MSMNNDLEQLAIRVCAEFREMPGLCLTIPQAQRLWGVDANTCSKLVALLVDRSVLRRQAETISLAKPILSQKGN